MNRVPPIIRTPIGIAVATVQWMVVAYAVLGDKAEGLGQSTVLQYYLLLLNVPAIFLTNLVAQPLTNMLGLAARAESIYFAIAVAAITLQWLLLGGLLQMFVDEIRPRGLANAEPLHMMFRSG